MVQVLLLTNILRINKVDKVVQRLHVPLISREKSGLYHLAVERALRSEVFRKYWGSKGKPVPRGRTTCAYNQQNAPNLLGERRSWARTLSSLNASSPYGRPVGQAPRAEGTYQDGRPGFTSQLDHFLSATFHFSEPVSPSVSGSDGRIACPEGVAATTCPMERAL